eukprot:s1381_g23.t1
MAVATQVLCYKEGLEEISKRLQQGVTRGDEAAINWAQVLHLALDVQQDYMERETALRAFYLALYGASRRKTLPRVPAPLHALARANPAGALKELASDQEDDEDEDYDEEDEEATMAAQTGMTGSS